MPNIASLEGDTTAALLKYFNTAQQCTPQHVQYALYTSESGLRSCEAT